MKTVMSTNNVSLPVSRLDLYLTFSSLYALLLTLNTLPSDRMPWLRLMLVVILFANTFWFSMAALREVKRCRQAAGV